MKIKANIPFTYKYPEEEPSEKRYYWAKETVTCEDFGSYAMAKLNTTWLNVQYENTVSIVLNGVLYSNLEIGHDGSGYSFIETEAFEIVVEDTGTVLPELRTPDVGEYEVGYVANMQPVKIALTNTGETASIYYYAAENDIVVNETAEVSGSSQIAVLRDADHDGYLLEIHGLDTFEGSEGITNDGSYILQDPYSPNASLTFQTTGK